MVFCMINKCDFLCNLVVVKLLYLIGKSGMGDNHDNHCDVQVIIMTIITFARTMLSFWEKGVTFDRFRFPKF